MKRTRSARLYFSIIGLLQSKCHARQLAKTSTEFHPTDPLSQPWVVAWISNDRRSCREHHRDTAQPHWPGIGRPWRRASCSNNGATTKSGPQRVAEDVRTRFAGLNAHSAQPNSGAQRLNDAHCTLAKRSGREPDRSGFGGSKSVYLGVHPTSTFQ